MIQPLYFKNCEQQPKLADEEKQKYMMKQQIIIQQNLKVMGLFIGGTGTIPKYFQDFWIDQNLNKLSLHKYK